MKTDENSWKTPEMATIKVIPMLMTNRDVNKADIP
jgi:hypothetical protein